MKLGTIAGGLTAAIGLAILAFVAVGLIGPIFYRADPFEADALRDCLILAGVAALLLGGAAVVSSRLRRRKPGRRSG